MQEAHGLSSAPLGRLEALKEKHSAIDHRIEEEQKFPSASDVLLRHLKRQKLHLKEAIEEEKRKVS